MLSDNPNDDFELMNTRVYGWQHNKMSGLSKQCDCVIFWGVIYNVPKSDVKTVFVCTRTNTYCIYKLGKLLDTLENKVNVVIAGEDWTFPNSIDSRHKPTNEKDRLYFQQIINHDKINKIFVENLDEDLGDKVISIPLGINSFECPVNLKYFLKFENLTKKPLLITDFNRKSRGHERYNVRKLCDTVWVHFFKKTREHTNESYLKLLSNSSAFTLCVHGGGLDPCPKLFDALLVGVIPIIRKTPQSSAFNSFPVVILDDWTPDAITEEKLKEWYDIYSPYFLQPELRNEVLKKLSLKYWVDKINDFQELEL